MRAALAVAAGVIRRADGAVLLALRAAHRHQGGRWEFPGGKLEAGERPVDALARELEEELGIRLARAVPLIRVQHAYPEHDVVLHVLEVDTWHGTPHGREGQEVRWVYPDDMTALRFPAANHPVVAAVRLPALALVVPAMAPGTHPVTSALTRLAACLAGGVRLVIWPAVDSFEAARALCEEHRARLVLQAQAAVADSANHAVAGRAPSGRTVTSCGVKFACHGVVRSTDGTRAWDWTRLARDVAAMPCPTYATGDLTPADAGTVRLAGCQGLALGDCLWGAAEPASIVRACSAAVQAVACAVG